MKKALIEIEGESIGVALQQLSIDYRFILVFPVLTELFDLMWSLFAVGYLQHRENLNLIQIVGIRGRHRQTNKQTILLLYKQTGRLETRAREREREREKER